MIMINYRKKAWPVNPVHIQFTISIIKKIVIISLSINCLNDDKEFVFTIIR